LKLKLTDHILLLLLVANNLFSQQISQATFSSFLIDNSEERNRISMLGTAGEVFVGVKNIENFNFLEGFLTLSDFYTHQDSFLTTGQN
jgi:hypothetical protein